MNLLHPPAQVEIALGGTILLFLVPQVPKEFCRGWPMPGVEGESTNQEQFLGVSFAKIERNIWVPLRLPVSPALLPVRSETIAGMCCKDFYNLWRSVQLLQRCTQGKKDKLGPAHWSSTPVSI